MNRYHFTVEEGGLVACGYSFYFFYINRAYIQHFIYTTRRGTTLDLPIASAQCRGPPLRCRAGISELGPALTASRCAAEKSLTIICSPLVVRSVAARADSSEQDRGHLLSSLLLEAAQSTACPCRRSVIMY
jgi:hypothetical protein